MRVAAIEAIAHHLPDGRVTNDDLAALYPDWSAQKIREKTGILERRVVAAGETASDLAHAAAQKLLERTGFAREQIDLLVYCTQSPDQFLPTTACVLQQRLGLPTSTAAFDYNLGCSAFPYGLAVVKSLIEAGIASNALLLMGETYSRYMHPMDKSVRTLFGDAGSATLVTAVERDEPSLGPFVLGTDGAGALGTDGTGTCAVAGSAASPATAAARTGPTVTQILLTLLRLPYRCVPAVVTPQTGRTRALQLSRGRADLILVGRRRRPARDPCSAAS